ncbi:hypothetical protein, partial [Massilia sp. TWP1-3-3]|uniref:hypothetical protein n=1 Tax=Massilia sp. TWP1-3-3 TaxID=2804573 RepID=UPI003CF98DC2
AGPRCDDASRSRAVASRQSVRLTIRYRDHQAIKHLARAQHTGKTPVRQLCSQFTGFEYDADFSQDEADPRMMSSFSTSADRVTPSITTDDWDAIEGHSAVSYILSPRTTTENALAVSGQTLALVAALLNAGASAVKGESSGIAHGRTYWLELADYAAKTSESALIRAWVRYPISDDSLLYSVGMHLLGLPDIEIDDAGTSEVDAVDALSGFMHFLLIDKRQNLDAGHTFHTRPDSARFQLSRTTCTRYEHDDFFYNPYGYWRLCPVT